jgi:hypothetical protein
LEEKCLGKSITNEYADIVFHQEEDDLWEMKNVAQTGDYKNENKRKVHSLKQMQTINQVSKFMVSVKFCFDTVLFSNRITIIRFNYVHYKSTEHLVLENLNFVRTVHR